MATISFFVSSISAQILNVFAKLSAVNTHCVSPLAIICPLFNKITSSDVLKVQDQNQIPELNVYQCGTYQMHSLQEAQDIARSILERDVRINSNEELALPKEKLQELHI